MGTSSKVYNNNKDNTHILSSIPSSFGSSFLLLSIYDIDIIIVLILLLYNRDAAALSTHKFVEYMKGIYMDNAVNSAVNSPNNEGLITNTTQAAR